MFDHEDEASTKTSVNEGCPLETKRWSSKYDIIISEQEIVRLFLENNELNIFCLSYIYNVIYVIICSKLRHVKDINISEIRNI